MPRRPRLCPPGFPVHIIQRGNNRQACFTTDQDVAAYASLLKGAACKYQVAVHGWVFMTNHVHLLVTPQQPNGLSRMMQHLGRHYVRQFNTQYARSGTLFEGRFKSCLVQGERYLLSCLRYIELNPVRAGMVRDPGDYLWSSYRVHAFGSKARLHTAHSCYKSLGTNSQERQHAYRDLVSQALPNETLAKIRHCTNTGLVLGTQAFREQVEKLRS